MLGIINPVAFVAHLGQGNHSGPSPALWNRLVGSHPSPDGCNAGVLVGDDFCNFQGITNAISGTTALPSATVPAPDGYKMYLDSATTASGAARLETEQFGAVQLAPGLTDNHLAVMYSGGLVQLSDTAGSERLTIWEARIRLPSQVTSGSIFAGLGNSVCVADGGLVADAGGLIVATGAGIGFRTLDADPDGIDFVLKTNSSGAEVVVLNEAKVATAATWIKLGFVYDPMADAAKRIKIYVDNVEQSTYGTATQIAAATFPDGINLGTLLACKSDGGSVARLMDCDWWYCYQARADAT